MLRNIKTLGKCNIHFLKRGFSSNEGKNIIQNKYYFFGLCGITPLYIYILNNHYKDDYYLKNKPYRRMYSSCMEGLLLGFVWPISMIPFFMTLGSLSLYKYIDKMDDEYEKNLLKEKK